MDREVLEIVRDLAYLMRYIRPSSMTAEGALLWRNGLTAVQDRVATLLVKPEVALKSAPIVTTLTEEEMQQIANELNHLPDDYGGDK